MYKILKQTVYLILGTILISASCTKTQVDKMPSTPWYPEKNESGELVKAVYESRVPCSDCQRLKLAVAFYAKPQDSIPSSYIMSRVYVGKSDDRHTDKGNVVLKYGTSLDSNHKVYQLTNAVNNFKNFWQMTDSLLFVLDDKFSPRVGDAGQGYVLNRVK